MKKLLFPLIFSFFGLAACSSNPVEPSSAKVHYAPPSLSLKLEQKLNYSQYPDEQALGKLVQSRITAAMKQQGLLADNTTQNPLTVTIDMHYRRVFAGEGTPLPSSSIAPPVVDYTIVVSDHGTEKARYQRNNITVNRGFGNNLVTIFTLGLGKTPKDEVADINILAKGIATDIGNLHVQ